MKKNSTNKNELISVIIPCYNVSNVVERCYKSLKNQTYKNYELIFVDDGSKDNTRNIINLLIQEDEKSKCIHKKNGGLSSARNYGLKYAKGKYVCFVDSDDYVTNDYIEELYKSIKANGTNISICDIERVYSSHNSINAMSKETIEMCRFPAAWNKMYLTELFTRYNVKFPEGKWYEDLGTTTKFILKENFSIVNKPLYKYIQNESSIMHTFDERIYQIYEVIEDVEKFAKKEKIYYEKKDILEFINIYHILIGTIFRASFKSDFNISEIKKISRYVEEKYPKWYKNKYIKQLNFFFRLFLCAIKLHAFLLIYVLLRIFGKKLSL